jgi:hypothetical protein
VRLRAWLPSAALALNTTPEVVAITPSEVALALALL